MGYSVEIQLTNCADTGEDAAYTKENWTGTITSENNKDYFIAVTGNKISESNAAYREITAQMFASPMAPEENTADAGMWVKTESESAVIVTLLDQNGKEVAVSDHQAYP